MAGKTPHLKQKIQKLKDFELIMVVCRWRFVVEYSVKHQFINKSNVNQEVFHSDFQ